MIQSGLYGPYFDGRNLRWGDSLAIWRLLESELGNPEQVLAAVESADPDRAIQAEAELVRAARKAFGLFSFDPTTGLGATDLAAKQLAVDVIQRSRG